MTRFVLGFALLAAIALADDATWPVNGGADNIRYSPLDPDQPRQRREAAGRLDLRLARRVQRLGDAEQPDRRRRRALRDDADAEGGRARTPRPGARSGRSTRAAARPPGAPLPASRRHASTRTACSSPTATCCARSTSRPASRSRRSASTAASTCARGSAGRPRARQRQRQHARRDLRGPAHHGQHACPRRCPARRATSAPST